jgi:hypothetical protein
MRVILRLGLFHFVSKQTAKNFAQLSQTGLPMRALAIGGEKENGEVLGRQIRVVASNATVIVLKNIGHWVIEEIPKRQLTR